MSNSKTKTDPKRWPRRHADALLPAGTVGVPDDLADADERLRQAACALDDAKDQRLAAEAAAKRAPKEDAAAALDAAKRGEAPPAPTAPQRDRELTVARQAQRGAEALAAGIAREHQRVFREHRLALAEAQRPRMDEAVRNLLAAITAVEVALPELEAVAGTIAHCQTVPVGPADGRHRFKSRTVRVAERDGSTLPATKMLENLRAAILGTVPGKPPTVAQLERERDHRRTEVALSKSAGGVMIR